MPYQLQRAAQPFRLNAHRGKHVARLKRARCACGPCRCTYAPLVKKRKQGFAGDALEGNAQNPRQTLILASVDAGMAYTLLNKDLHALTQCPHV